MLVKKLTPEAVLPTQANPGDAGLDIVATSVTHTARYIEYGTGLSVAVPQGFLGLLCPRSSVSNKHLRMCNSVGVIDSSFRGELKVRFALTLPYNMGDIYSVGDRVAQLVIMPFVEAKVLEVQELPETQRGTGGWGSSGA